MKELTEQIKKIMIEVENITIGAMHNKCAFADTDHYVSKILSLISEQQKEEAKEMYDKGTDHFFSMPKFVGTSEDISEAVNEWIDESFKIASGHKEE